MILKRYIFKSLSVHLFVIVFTFIAIFMMIAYFHFVKEAAIAKLNPSDIAKILITEIPVLLQPILPLSLFLAIFLVFRRMYSCNEIISMHAAGQNDFNLFMPVIVMCVLLSLLSSYMELFIFPLANTKRIHLFEESIHKVTFEKIFPKQFNEFPSNIVVYVDKKDNKNKKIEGIFFSATTPDYDNQLSYDVIIAKSVEEQILPDRSKYILFKNGTRYNAKINNLESLITDFEKFGLRLPSVAYRLEDWPGCMKIKELYVMAKVDRYAAAELHWRISIPISIINLTFFAFAFNKNRIQGYLKPITTIYPLLVYLFYVNLILMGVGLIKNEMLNKSIGLWIIHGAMFIFCMFTLKYKPR